MKKMSLQWRLTCIITIYIALICGCLTMFVYRNGVYYIDSLQEAVEAQGDNKGDDSEQIYISIPEDKWDEFAKDFSVQVYNNKADYKRNSLIISVLLALLGGGVTYFISGRALKPIGEFSDKIEEVQLQNLSDSQIEENQVKELNRLSVSYNKMLERLSEAFKIQRQFTENAAHELQTVGRDETIIVNALIDEVLEDLEPLAQEKNIKLTGKCKDVNMVGSDILIYRLVYNLVENAIKYNHSGGQVIVEAYQKEKQVYLSVKDTGNGIPEELKERVFEPFFRVDKSRSRELGGVGLGLALVNEIVRVHDGSIAIRPNPSGGTIIEVQFAVNRTTA
ncbi:MAG: HAMP domain-containing histidine kinase [Lachnospira sp.]|nr:HAMP domain-containing histidine kinase [Lachnospira sp.]MDD5829981.1 HAMP domain-containing sensor histidine kinase [Lachnospira sp.]